MTPKVPREPACQPAAEQEIARAGQAQGPPLPAGPEQVRRREERRLVKPDIPIQRLAEKHLTRGGQRQRLFRPQNSYVTQVRAQRDHEDQREKQARDSQAVVLTDLERMRSRTSRKPSPYMGS